MSDTVRIQGMQFYAHHGVDPEETKLGQRFELDVELHLDLVAAGRHDDLTQTVNYRDVYALVATEMETASLLIEAVAERVAAGILGGFPVDAVTIRVRKPSVPLGGVVAYTEVEIRRGRG